MRRGKKMGSVWVAWRGPEDWKTKALRAVTLPKGRSDGEEAQWHGRSGSSNFHMANPQIPQQGARGRWSQRVHSGVKGGGKGMLRAGKIALAHKTWGQAWLWPCSFRSSLGLTQASAFSCQAPRPTPLPLILSGSFFLLWEAFLIGFFFLGPNAVSFLCSPKHQGCCFNVHFH